MNTNFDFTFNCNGVIFRYAKGRSVKYGNEIHPYHEIIYLINGEGKCFTEHFDIKLNNETFFVIPKNTYHRFAITDQNNYTRLTIAFDNDDALLDVPLFVKERVHIWDTSDEELSYLLNKIVSTISKEENESQKKRIMSACFKLIISKCFEKSNISQEHELEGSRMLIYKCTQYIDANFSKEINVDRLAKMMNVSTSALFGYFKKHLGISVYKYVLQKRMAHAHKLLSQGKQPTKIYLECGYNDYVTFYKAFVNRFGYSPSEAIDKKVED